MALPNNNRGLPNLNNPNSNQPRGIPRPRQGVPNLGKSPQSRASSGGLPMGSGGVPRRHAPGNNARGSTMHRGGGPQGLPQQQGGASGTQRMGGGSGSAPEQSPGRSGVQEQVNLDKNVSSLSDYDFGGEASKYKNPYDDGEDPFQQLSVDEQLNDDILLDDDFFDAPMDDSFDIDDNVSDDSFEIDEVELELDEKPKKKQRIKNRTDRKVDHTNQDVFADVEEIKIKPLGGDTKVKVSRYDARKNRRQQAIIIQFSIIGILSLILLIGLKNAIFPPATLSEADVSNIIINQMDLTEFPVEKGRGFVTDFMSVYLTVDPKNETNNDVLNHFLSGSFTSSVTDFDLIRSGDFIQNVIFGPTIYEEKPISDYSMSYVVGAYIQQFKPLPENFDENSGENFQTVVSDGVEYRTLEIEERWVFFNISVMYDPTIDKIGVSYSPTLIPNYEVLPVNEVPEHSKIGDGEEDKELLTAITPIIHNFFDAYKDASSENAASRLESYIISDPPNSLLNGLNGEVDFANGSASDSMEILAYNSTIPGEYRAKVRVEWVFNYVDKEDSGGEKNTGISFYSTYFVSLVNSGSEDSKFLISDLSSFPYVPSDQWIEKIEGEIDAEG